MTENQVPEYTVSYSVVEDVSPYKVLTIGKDPSLYK